MGAKNGNPLYESNRQAWKNFMVGYNLIMAVFSLCLFVGMASVMLSDGMTVFSLGNFDEPSGWYRMLTWVFYVSKYVEFLDTWFLILRQVPVSWLQWVHHVGAVLTFGVLHHSQLECSWLGPLFNGFIHTIMYYYYACCIRKWPFPCKRMLTILQVLQFVSGMAVQWTYPWVLPGFADYVPSNSPPDAPPGWRWFAHCWGFGYLVILVVLFANFYYKTYIVGKPPKAKEV